MTKIQKRKRLNSIFGILIFMVLIMTPINLEIAKTVGSPIDPARPISVELTSIANYVPVECGEDSYVFQSLDSNIDIVYTAGDNGEVISIKKSPTGAVAIDMYGYQSLLTYITLNEIAGAKDNVDILSRKKLSISRSMDKYELQTMLNLILNTGACEVELDSSDDIYSGIMKMAHKVIDYGDNFVLLCGSTVWEKINSYDRDNVVGSFNYRLGIFDMLKSFGIEVLKITGDICLDTTSASSAVLSATKAILIARDSTITSGKPLVFCRRKFSPEISKEIGENAGAERILLTIGNLAVINAGKNILGYAVVGYENIGFALTNYLACAYCDELTNPA